MCIRIVMWVGVIRIYSHFQNMFHYQWPPELMRGGRPFVTGIRLSVVLALWSEINDLGHSVNHTPFILRIFIKN